MFKFSEKFPIFLICIQVFVTLNVVFGKDEDSLSESAESMCGLKKIVRTPKIINGKDAYHGQFPWAVSLRLHRRHHCGGALINHNWVLTAAHCVSQISHRVFTVRLGGHYRNVDQEPTSIEIPVKMVVPHEGFSFSSFANDIALVKLGKSVEFNNYIWPICLPQTNTTDYANQTGVVIGWGKITPSGISASTLQQVELPIIDNTKCIKWYESQGKVIPIRSSQFCAGLEEGGKDACQGDSGSPMMKMDQTNGQAMAIGIVSAGIGCALPKLPGLYTRIASYLPWIKAIVNAVPADKVPNFPDISKIFNTTVPIHVKPPKFNTTIPIHILPPNKLNHTIPTVPIHTIPPNANVSVIIINLTNLTHPTHPSPVQTPLTTANLSTATFSTTTLSTNTTIV